MATANSIKRNCIKVPQYCQIGFPELKFLRFSCYKQNDNTLEILNGGHQFLKTVEETTNTGIKEYYVTLSTV